MLRARPVRNPSFRHLLVCFLSVAFVSPALAGPACFDSWKAERLAEVREEADSVEALLPLREVLDAAVTAADPSLIATELESIRRTGDADPLVGAELDHTLLSFDLRSGRFDAARERARRLGMVTSWLVSGPFEDEREAFARLEELGQDSGDSTWRHLRADPTGVLPLHYAMFPQTERLALAVFYLRAERDTAVALRFGADDRAELRLDGRTLFARPERHDAAFDQHAVLLPLDKGLHRVSFLIEQQDDAWLLRARLSAPDGSPLGPHVTLVRNPDPVPLESELEGALEERGSRSASSQRRFGRKLRRADGELRTVLAELESMAERGGPRARAALALELAVRELPARNDGEALVVARGAAREEPGDPRVEWVVSAVETEPSRRREALERILDRHPDHVIALRLLAGYHLAFSRSEKALELSERALAACGNPDPYMEGQRALARDGSLFAMGTLAGLEEALESAPHQPMLLKRLAELYQAEGMALRERRTRETLVEHDRLDVEARRELLRVLLDAGDGRAFLSRVEDARRLDPTNPAPAVRLARFHLAQGRPERAVGILEDALERAPGNPDLLATLGESFVALGEEESAASAWKAVLETVGEDEDLSRRIASLEGRRLGGSEWRVPMEEALAVETREIPEGDPPFVVLSATTAFRVQASGLATRYRQLAIRVRHAERASSARFHQVSFSPSLQEVTVHGARILRKDGTVLLANRSTRHVLPDVELRMWYDTRVLSLAFPRLEDGDLIDIRYSVTDRGPRNQIGEGYFGAIELLGRDVPVLSSRVVLDAPGELPLTHRFVHLEDARETRLEREGRVVRVFDIPPLPAFEDAPQSPPPTEWLPYLVVGSVEDWPQLGRIYADLIRDQLATPPDLEELVADLTRGASGRRDVIRRLYEWVIGNTRYVALEFGIHALKPYAVRSVLHRRHGDCKDKAALLVAMLREAGVEAKVTLLRTSMRGDVDTSVPTFSIFDHAIVYVPDEDLWLDGTVLHHALGETPLVDLGTLALPVDTAGETSWPLLRTPEPTPENARRVETQSLSVEPDGSAVVTSRVLAEGEFAALERHYFRDRDRPVRVLGNVLQAEHPDLRLLSAEFPSVGLDDETVEFGWKAEKKRFGRREGSRISLPMGLGIPPLELLEPGVERTVAIRLPDPLIRRLETELSIPEGFDVAESPRSVDLRSEWGSVRVDSRKTRRGLDLEIEVRLVGGRVEVAAIPEYREFVARAREALEQRVILEERP